jgi:hypothetical protein
MKPYKPILLPYEAYIGPPAKDGTEAFGPTGGLKAFRPSLEAVTWRTFSWALLLALCAARCVEAQETAVTFGECSVRLNADSDVREPARFCLLPAEVTGSSYTCGSAHWNQWRRIQKARCGRGDHPPVAMTVWRAAAFLRVACGTCTIRQIIKQVCRLPR